MYIAVTHTHIQDFPWASLVAYMVKNLPKMWETQIQSLDQEAPLEKDKATHSSILAWEIHGQRSMTSYNPWGHKRVKHGLATKVRIPV